VRTQAALEAALATAGSDITLAPGLGWRGDLRVRASDVRLSGSSGSVASSVSNGAILLDQGIARILLEDLTATRVAWTPPLRFDDRLGQPVSNPRLQINDVMLRNLVLTGQRGESTIDVSGNRTLVQNCQLTAPDQYCLWGSPRSPLTASPSNPTPFGISDLLVVGCTMTNTSSGQANLRVHGCLRQVVSHCVFHTGRNFSLRSHEGSHLVHWSDCVLNHGGFMLTDHAAPQRDTIGSMFLRRLTIHYTNTNGPISTPAASEGGLARIGARGPSYFEITRPGVVLDQVVVHDPSYRSGSFRELLGERTLPGNWQVTQCDWRRP
jgi:hypothetical protein